MARLYRAVFVLDRQLSSAGAGTGYGDIFRFFRDTCPIANCTCRKKPLSLQKTIHIRLSNEPAGFVQLGAEPAQDRRSVRQLSFLKCGKQTCFAASALLGFDNTVAMAGLGHVNTPLFPA